MAWSKFSRVVRGSTAAAILSATLLVMPLDAITHTADAAPSGFVSISPVRVFDTRPTTAQGAVAVSKSKVVPASPLEVAFGGVGGLPSGAASVSLNVTVAGGLTGGYLTVYPCGTLPPTSTANWSAGRTIANAAVVQLSAAGHLCFFASKAVHVIVDINGWFTTGSMTAFTPNRFVDTRPDTAQGTVTVNKEMVMPGTPLEVQVAGQGDVPGDSPAVTANITAVGPTQTGFLTVYPCGVAPLASTLNFTFGQTVAAAAVATLSQSGTICVATSVPVHVLIDVAGWLPATTYHAVTPIRLVDTRPTTPAGAVVVTKAPIGVGPVTCLGKAPTITGTSGKDTLIGTSGNDVIVGLGGNDRIEGRAGNDTICGKADPATIRVPLRGRAGLPAEGVTAVIVTVTVAGPVGAGYASAVPCNGSLTTSTVNFAYKENRANLAISQLSALGDLCFYASVRTHLIVDLVGWLPLPSTAKPVPNMAGPVAARTEAAQAPTESNFLVGGSGQDTCLSGDGADIASVCEPPADPYRFGLDGRVYAADIDGFTASGFASQDGGGTVIDSQGRLVIAGRGRIVLPSGAVYDGRVVYRLTATGDIDPTFNRYPASTISVPIASGFRAVAVDSEDRIYLALVGGAIDIIRLLPTGEIDTSYGVGGVSHNLLGYAVWLGEMVMQDDDTLLIAGTGDSRPFIAKLTTAGAPDTTFGTAGVAVVPNPPSSSGAGMALAVLPGGSLMLGVTYTHPCPPQCNIEDSVLVKFTATGTIDTTFGTNGKTPLNFKNSTRFNLARLAIDADDNIVVVGFSMSTAIPYQIGVVRVTPAGQQDITFASPAIGTPVGNYNVYASDLLVLPDGKTLVAGPQSNGQWVLARLNTDGTIDTTFGTGGYAVSGVDPDYAVGFAVEILPAGNGGMFLSGGLNGSILTLRYTADGTTIR